MYFISVAVLLVTDNILIKDLQGLFHIKARLLSTACRRTLIDLNVILKGCNLLLLFLLKDSTFNSIVFTTVAWCYFKGRTGTH